MTNDFLFETLTSIERMVANFGIPGQIQRYTHFFNLNPRSSLSKHCSNKSNLF